MTNLPLSRFLRVALFILVPVAYLSIRFWRPYYADGGAEVFPAMTFFMAIVCLVSVLSWSENRLVASLGFVACLLWLATVLLPVAA
jgi:hypothetical protein